MTETQQIKLNISRKAYLHLKRIALGARRPMNKQLEVMIEEWPRLTRALMPALGALRTPTEAPASAEQDEDDIVPF